MRIGHMSETYNSKEQHKKLRKWCMQVEKWQRSLPIYRKTMDLIADALNHWKGDLQVSCSTDDLKRTGFVRFQASEFDLSIPFDIRRIHKLFYHFRQMASLALQKIDLPMKEKKYLAQWRLADRDLLGWCFSDHCLSEDALKAKQTIRELCVEAEQSRITRCLELHTRALAVYAGIRTRFSLIEQVVNDHSHPKYEPAASWRDRMFPQMGGLEERAQKLLAELEPEKIVIFMRASGIPFKKDLAQRVHMPELYELETDLVRGAAYIRCLNPEAAAVARLTPPFFLESRIRWNLSWFHEQYQDKLLADDVLGLVELFQELAIGVGRATRLRGEIQTAIAHNFSMGLLSVKEMEEIKNWTSKNRSKLLDFYLTLFQRLRAFLAESPQLALPGDLKNLLLEEDGPPWIDFKALEGMAAILANLGEARGDADLTKLNLALNLRRKIERALEALVHPATLTNFRKSRTPLFHERLRDMSNLEGKLEGMLLKLDAWICSAFECQPFFTIQGLRDELRHPHYLKPSIFRAVVDIVERQICSAFQHLDFRNLYVQKHQRCLDQALAMNRTTLPYRLATLLELLNRFPQEEQLLKALNNRSGLLAPVLAEKQGEIINAYSKLRMFREKVFGLLSQIFEKHSLPTLHLRFLAFKIHSCEAAVFHKRVRQLASYIPQMATLQESEELMYWFRQLREALFTAQIANRKHEKSYQRLARMQHSSVLQKNLNQLQADLEKNFGDLDKCLLILLRCLEKIEVFRASLNKKRGEDNPLVSVTFSLFEHRAKTLSFVENISDSQITRYLVVQEQIQVLLKRHGANLASLNHQLLREDRALMKCVCRYLALSLSFISHYYVLEQGAGAEILEMMRRAGLHEDNKILRIKLTGHLKSYKPEIPGNNFQLSCNLFLEELDKCLERMRKQAF